MRWQVLAVGKPKLDFAAAGIAEYLGRLKSSTQVKVEWVKNGGRDMEGKALLDRSAGMFRIVMDERGEELGSAQLAKKISGWEQRSVKGVALLVGGADGHSEEVRRGADWQWSLSRLTLQHELALMLALEQVYRAYTIKAGLPYHREG
jgi:23S rRNA (pseudouridine1915-N3)-methyltransferase